MPRTTKSVVQRRRISEETRPPEPTRPTLQITLDAVLDRPGRSGSVPEMLEALARIDPDLFFLAGLARLESGSGSPSYKKRSLRLFDSPAFLLALIRSKRFNLNSLIEFCARYARQDSLLDVKLARLLPEQLTGRHHLEPELNLRILEVLDEISQGTRLLTIVDHLASSPDPRVASKAALLIGRRLQNRQWIERHVSSKDARVRANVVEALWGVESELARRTLRKCLLDASNRVRGNAIVGLHLLGDRRLNSYVRSLVKDGRARFRQTAAWVIGRVRSPGLTALLDVLLQDPSPDVRRSAQSTLSSLRQPAPQDSHQDSGTLIDPNVQSED